MRRRDVLSLLAVITAVHKPQAKAQQPAIPVIGFLSHIPIPAIADRLEAFRQGLKALDYEEGKNIAIELRSANGDYSRLPQLAADLVRRDVAVIVTTGQPVPNVVYRATRKIPIVFTVVGDPIADGLVASLNRPGGNATGLSSAAQAHVGKQLQLFKEGLPRLSRVAVFHDPKHPGHKQNLADAQVAAALLRLQLVPIGINGERDVEAAFRSALAERVDGAMILRGAVLVQLRQRLVSLAIKTRIPTMFGHPEEAEEGGLMSYGSDVVENYRRAAFYVDKILRGADPAELPVQQPTTFKLIINLKTAKLIGVTISQLLLASADKVIE